MTAIDNLDNSFEEVLRRLKKLAGDKADKLDFVKVRPERTEDPAPLRLLKRSK